MESIHLSIYFDLNNNNNNMLCHPLLHHHHQLDHQCRMTSFKHTQQPPSPPLTTAISNTYCPLHGPLPCQSLNWWWWWPGRTRHSIVRWSYQGGGGSGGGDGGSDGSGAGGDGDGGDGQLNVDTTVTQVKQWGWWRRPGEGQHSGESTCHLTHYQHNDTTVLTSSQHCNLSTYSFTPSVFKSLFRNFVQANARQFYSTLEHPWWPNTHWNG